MFQNPHMRMQMPQQQMPQQPMPQQGYPDYATLMAMYNQLQMQQQAMARQMQRPMQQQMMGGMPMQPGMDPNNMMAMINQLQQQLQMLQSGGRQATGIPQAPGPARNFSPSTTEDRFGSVAASAPQPAPAPQVLQSFTPQPTISTPQVDAMSQISTPVAETPDLLEDGRLYPKPDAYYHPLATKVKLPAAAAFAKKDVDHTAASYVVDRFITTGPVAIENSFNADIGKKHLHRVDTFNTVDRQLAVKIDDTLDEWMACFDGKSIKIREFSRALKRLLAKANTPLLAKMADKMNEIFTYAINDYLEIFFGTDTTIDSFCEDYDEVKKAIRASFSDDESVAEGLDTVVLRVITGLFEYRMQNNSEEDVATFVPVLGMTTITSKLSSHEVGIRNVGYQYVEIDQTEASALSRLLDEASKNDHKGFMLLCCSDYRYYRALVVEDKQYIRRIKS